MERKYIFNFLILVMILFLFTGCTGIESETENASIEDKTISEIEYLEDEIFTIVNKYTKNEYMSAEASGDEEDTETFSIDWSKVSEDCQQIAKVLDTVMLDFGEAKVPNEELIAFRTEINNLIVASSNEDEHTMLKSASNLYGLLPEYYGRFSENKNEKEVMSLKSLVLQSYTSAFFSEWEDAKSAAALAETKYKEMSDNLEYMKEHSYNLNKVYILVEEYKNAVDLEQVDLAKVKYINFIEKF